jgi:zinc-ribbon domain
MAIIKCPECGSQVSDKATACPSCAHPVGAVTLIEQTAKRWKAVQMYGVAGMLLGLLFVFAAIGSESFAVSMLAGLVTAAGIAIYSVGRIAAWWHHG